MFDPGSSEARLRGTAKLDRYNRDLLAHSRALIARSLALLRQTAPSTYLGKPRRSEVIGRKPASERRAHLRSHDRDQG
jgi:hypothetical protein